MANGSESGVVSIRDDQMTAVTKDFFFEGMILPVHVYLRIKPSSYLMIGKKSEKASFSDLHSYQNPETSIFVKAQDYQTLIYHITEFTGKIVQQKSVPSVIKTKFLNALTEKAIESFNGTGMASVAQIQVVSQHIVELTQTMTNFNEVIDLLMALPASESKHSMACCMMSVMICEEMQLTHKAALEKVALGALLHDVGLKTVPKHIIDKPRHLWTPDEQQIYEQHPLRGAQMLRDLKEISTDVLLIIAEHHENASGTGFPKRIRDVKVSPLGRIVGMANAFTDLLFCRHQGGRNYSPDEAVSFIEDILGQPYNKHTFLALKNIINKKVLKDKLAA